MANDLLYPNYQAPMPARPVVAGITPKPAAAAAPAVVDTRGMTRTMPGQYDPLGARTPEVIAAGNVQQAKYAEQKIADAHKKEVQAMPGSERRLVYVSEGDWPGKIKDGNSVFSTPTMGGNPTVQQTPLVYKPQEPGGYVAPKEQEAKPLRDPFEPPPSPQTTGMRPAPTPTDPYQGMVKSNPIQDALLASASAQADREQKAQSLLDNLPQLDTSSIGKWLTSAQQIKRARGIAGAYTDINKRDPLATASAAQTAETTTGMTNKTSLQKELMGNTTQLEVADMQAEASKYGHDLSHDAAMAAVKLKIPAAQLDQLAINVMEKVGTGKGMISLEDANDIIASSKGKGGATWSQQINQATGQPSVIQTGGIGAKGDTYVEGVKADRIKKQTNAFNQAVQSEPDNAKRDAMANKLKQVNPELYASVIKSGGKPL